MLTFHAFVLWLHLAAIVVWLGGMISISFVVLPALRRRDVELVEVLVRRFLRVSRELVFVILLTGIFNVINAGVAADFAFSAQYLWIVGCKLVLFLLIAANQAWYGLVLVPRSRTRAATWVVVVNAVLSAVVLYLGIMLRYG